MDEVVVAEEAGASSSAVGADSDDSLAQPPTIPLVESIDEGLVPDIIAGTAGTSSVFQSAWVDLLVHSNILPINDQYPVSHSCHGDWPVMQHHFSHCVCVFCVVWF